jgi:hypothetical protein
VGFEVVAHDQVLAVEDQLRRRLLARFAEEKIALAPVRTEVVLAR